MGYRQLSLSLICILVFVGYGQAQHYFVENAGQWDDEILFQSEFSGGVLYIEKGAFNYNFYDADHLDELVHDHHKDKAYYDPVDWTVDAHCLKMRFIGSAAFNISNNYKIPEHFNYYLGNDPEKWASNVGGFQELHFHEIYEKIDLRFNTHYGKFKYDLIIQPGAEASSIKMVYEGAESIEIINDRLKVTTSVNTLIEQKPYAYQLLNNEKVQVKCQYTLVDGIIGFDFPDGYDSSIELVIDPFIVFSRYSSSFANNFGYTATYDNDDNAYGAGSVFGVGYQTVAGSYEIDFTGGTVDVGITKYSADGLNRLFATYIGGTDTELPHSLVVNSRNELYVFGTTSSSDFPIDINLTTIDGSYNGGNFANFSNGLGVNYNFGSDLFVARFTEDGDALLSSTFLGGSENDGLNTSTFLKYNYADEVRGEVLIDSEDNCYVVTCTASPDFPIVNGFQNTLQGGLDAIVIKMDDNLTNILWSSFVGGSDDDAAYSIAFDPDENLVIAGGTRSINFPNTGAFQANFEGGFSDGFISKIHKSGSGILHSTYYGTNDYDQIYFVETNEVGEVYVFGQTNGPSGNLIQNAAYNKPNGGQLLAKFNETVDTLVWSTRFGDEAGVPDISPTAFLVDVCQQIFISGWGSQGLGGINSISGSAGLDVTADALQSTTDNADFYFMVMRSDASQLVYASYFGGPLSSEHVDGGTSRFDKKGVVYQAVCAGCGSLQDFPTVPTDSIPLWPNNNSCNLGIVKYAFTPPSIIADFDVPDIDCVPISLFFENQSQTAFNDTSQTDFNWTINDSMINSYHLNYDFVTPGTYSIKLVAHDTSSCNLVDSITKVITIIGNGFTNLDTLVTCNNRPIQIGIPPISGSNIDYQWTPSNTLSSSEISNPFANPTSTTTYTLIVSNNNCRDTIVQTVVSENLDFSIDVRDSICLGDTLTATAVLNENAFVSWEPVSSLQSGQGTISAVFSLDEPTWVSAEVVNDIGCTAEDSIFVTLLTDLPDLMVTADPDTIFAGETSQLEATSLDVNTFLWDVDTSLSSLVISDPVASPTATTNYTVRIQGDDCPNKADITVFILQKGCENGEIFVPNAFAPNNNGSNEVFRVRSTLDITDFRFAVYDRWGNRMFETKDLNEGWDGKLNNEPLSPQVFAWYAEGICPNGDPILLKGNVTLLR